MHAIVSKTDPYDLLIYEGEKVNQKGKLGNTKYYYHNEASLPEDFKTNVYVQDLQPADILMFDREENNKIYLVYDQVKLADRIEKFKSAKWVVIRARRNQLLRETDHYFIQQFYIRLSPFDQQTMKNYRQTLLDIPQTYDDPYDVVWPDVPDVKIPNEEETTEETVEGDPNL